jgi:hypothetical protein
MQIFKNLILLSSSLIFSASIYAGSIQELSSDNVDKCRQEIAANSQKQSVVVLAYSKQNTGANTLKLYQTVANERPNTAFFQYDLDRAALFEGLVTRLCLGQQFSVRPDTLMIVSNNDIGFLHGLFGTRDGSLSNKAQVEEIIDDFNEKNLTNRHIAH